MPNTRKKTSVNSVDSGFVLTLYDRCIGLSVLHSYGFRYLLLTLVHPAPILPLCDCSFEPILLTTV